MPISSFFDLESGTTIVGYLAADKKTRVVFANDAGFGLLCTVGDLFARVRAGRTFMRVGEGVKLLPPATVPEKAGKLACLSTQGRLLVFDLTELRVLSDGGKGVTLMDLNPGEKLSDILVCGEAGCVVEGIGRTRTREKTLVRGDWQRHFGHRARKGKPIEIRFKATNLKPLMTDENGRATTGSNEEEPEPTLL